MIETIKSLVLETAQSLIKHRLMLTTAESCTGGGLSYWLTSVPGSSDWFERGFVTYSNAAKVDMLGVKVQTLEKFGAVSEQTAREMVEGAISHSKSTLAIAITGIAGPTGGSPDKPVGTVWLGCGGQKIPVSAQLHTFNGDRQAIRLAAILKSLELLLETIKCSS